MSVKHPPQARDPRTVIRRAAVALVERAERRAQTCGGAPHEYVTKAEYEALKQALTRIRQ